MVVTPPTLATSSQLFEIVQDQLTLDSSTISFDWLEDTSEAHFSRISDYKRFANRIENHGISEYLTWISRRHDRLKSDFEYCTISRHSKFDHQGEIAFYKPIDVILNRINDQPIIGRINRIKGHFSYEWIWLNNGRQSDIANALQVYFNCQEYFID